MVKTAANDLAITALTLEAERRRKAKGLLRYNYGDLMADTTPEERQRIIENYKIRQKRRSRETGERFTEVDDGDDLRAIRERQGYRE